MKKINWLILNFMLTQSTALMTHKWLPCPHNTGSRKIIENIVYFAIKTWFPQWFCWWKARWGVSANQNFLFLKVILIIMYFKIVITSVLWHRIAFRLSQQNFPKRRIQYRKCILKIQPCLFFCVVCLIVNLEELIVFLSFLKRC